MSERDLINHTPATLLLLTEALQSAEAERCSFIRSPDAPVMSLPPRSVRPSRAHHSSPRVHCCMVYDFT